jgi:hypothetical protein
MDISKNTNIFRIVLLIAGLAAAPSHSAGLKNENFLLNLPKNYTEGYKAGNKKQIIVEYVPKGQSVKNWKEMVTLRIWFGGLQGTPRQYVKKFLSSLANTCATSTGKIDAKKKENGYPTIMFSYSCPQSRPKSSEWGVAKFYHGRDSDYLVIKAWKKKPRTDDLSKWRDRLNEINICDTRRKNAPCP